MERYCRYLGTYAPIIHLFGYLRQVHVLPWCFDWLALLYRDFWKPPLMSFSSPVLFKSLTTVFMSVSISVSLLLDSAFLQFDICICPSIASYLGPNLRCELDDLFSFYRNLDHGIRANVV